MALNLTGVLQQRAICASDASVKTTTTRRALAASLMSSNVFVSSLAKQGFARLLRWRVWVPVVVAGAGRRAKLHAGREAGFRAELESMMCPEI
jgi:hypothetical protein